MVEADGKETTPYAINHHIVCTIYYLQNGDNHNSSV